MSTLLDIKKALYIQCCAIVNEKIEYAQQGMDAAQEAANKEGKSSMGDKYETGRAMMHLEKDKRAMQLVQVAKMKKALDLMKVNKELDEIQFGSLVKTRSANYFLAVSIGQLKVNEEHYLATSPLTTIAQLLRGLLK